MSSLVYLRGELVDTTTQYAELRDLYENRHRYNRMSLTCTREHRGRMYLRLSRTDKNRLEVAHYPGQGGPGCTRTIHHEAEGIPHRTFKGYSARACESAGYTVTPEFKTTPPTGHRSTRLELAVQAPTPFGIEAQFSTITQRDAKSRTTSSFHAAGRRCGSPAASKSRRRSATRAATAAQRHRNRLAHHAVEGHRIRHQHQTHPRRALHRHRPVRSLSQSARRILRPMASLVQRAGAGLDAGRRAGRYRRRCPGHPPRCDADRAPGARRRPTRLSRVDRSHRRTHPPETPPRAGRSRITSHGHATRTGQSRRTNPSRRCARSTRSPTATRASSGAATNCSRHRR
jgi:hypothetical protein